MRVHRWLSAAAVLGAVCVLASDAEAAKKKAAADKDTVTVTGCAQTMVPSVCTAIWTGSATYVVNSAKPAIPPNTSVTVVGKKTSDTSPCFGTWLEVKSWKKAGKACK